MSEVAELGREELLVIVKTLTDELSVYRSKADAKRKYNRDYMRPYMKKRRRANAG